VQNPEVEFYVDEAGEHRWRLKGANGEIVAVGEGHTTADDARDAFERIPLLSAAAAEALR
jgi:uncharacterized protein YegP (UPF0339 family)